MIAPGTVWRSLKTDVCRQAVSSAIAAFILFGAVCICTAFSQQLDWKDISGNVGDEPVYVVTARGAILFSQREKGIFRSTDNGLTWLASDSGLASLRVLSVQSGPGQDELFCNTRDGAIYRSIDDGMSWQSFSTMPTTGLFLLRTVQGLFYGWSREVGVYRSVDAGLHWTKVFSPPFEYDQPMALSADSAGRLFLGTNLNGIYRSGDSGRSWAHVHTATFRCDRFYQASDQLLYAWVNGNAKLSTDHGTTWGGAPIAGGAIQLQFDGDVFYALRTTGLSRSLDSGKTYQESVKYTVDGFWVAPNHSILLWRKGRSLSVVPSFGEDEIIVSYWLKQSRSFCASNGGRLYALNFDGQLLESRDGGLSWVGPHEYSMIKAFDIVRDRNGAVAALLEQNFTKRFVVKASDTSSWISSILDPMCGNPQMLSSPAPGVFDFLCGTKMFRTRDYGGTWTTIDLTPPGDSINSYECFFTHGDSLIIAGSQQRLSTTTDLGHTWFHDPRGVYPRFAQHQLARTASGTIYCARGSILYSTDSGIHWLSPSPSAGGPWSITIDSVGHILAGGGPSGGWISLASPLDKWKGHVDTLRSMAGYAWYTTPDGRILVGAEKGTFCAIGPKPDGTSEVTATMLPRDLRLHSPFPNPFRTGVELPFSLLARAKVVITICNMLGAQVAQISDAELVPGQHTLHWNGRDDNGSPLPPGCYLVRLSAGLQSATTRLVKLQ